MHQYKIGDKILIRKDLGQHNHSSWVSEMDEFSGRILTVESIHEGFVKCINGSRWLWFHDMIDTKTPLLSIIDLEPSKKYICDKGQLWATDSLEIRDEGGVDITEICYAMDLVKKRFVEVEVEAEIDWHEVEVDTPIQVSDNGESWYNRYFAGLLDDSVYAFRYGATSWTATERTRWAYARLVNE